MKLSDVRKQIDELISKEGDIDLGDVDAVSLFYAREGWAGPWHTRVRQTGLHWATPRDPHSGGHFIGTEEVTERTRYDSSYRPTDSEMGEPVVTEVRR